MPIHPPETAPTVTLSEALAELLVAPSNILMPSAPPVIGPVAVSSVLPAPSLSMCTACPPAEPVTVATLIVMLLAAPLLLWAFTVLPPDAIFLSSPVAVIEMLPAPEFVARITSFWLVIVWPSGSWVNVMPPAPVWFRVNARPWFTVTSVPAARVTPTSEPIASTVTAVATLTLVPSVSVSKLDAVASERTPDAVTSKASAPAPKSIEPPAVPPARITLSLPPPSLIAPFT